MDFVVCYILLLAHINVVDSHMKFSKGVADKFIKKRINGGTDVGSVMKYPWTVLLWDASQGKLVCGGALIGPKFILTAASCFRSGKNYDVYIGKYNSSCEFGEIFSQRRFITTIYKTFTSEVHDIALATLDEAVDINSHSKPIQLPDFGSEVNYASHCVVTSWGSSDVKSKDDPEVLQELQVPIWDDDLCDKLLGEKYSKKMICGGYSSGRKYVSSYDTGSPLVCKELFGNWFLAGVVTRTDTNGKVAAFGSPMVFGKISRATSLIKIILSKA